MLVPAVCFPKTHMTNFVSKAALNGIKVFVPQAANGNDMGLF